MKNKIVLLVVFTLFFTGCQSNVLNLGEDNYAYIYAFNNFDVLILLASMIISNFIYTKILVPLVFPFLLLALIFEVINFFFKMFKQETEETLFFNSKRIINFIFKLIGILVLLIGVNTGIKVITANKKPDAPSSFNNLQELYNSFELMPARKLHWSDKPKDLFNPDSFLFINTNATYGQFFSTIPFMKSVISDKAGEVKLRLPLAISISLSIADSILYGKDPSKEGSKGIIPSLFPNSYPILVQDPSLIFKAIFFNLNTSLSNDTKYSITSDLIKIAQEKLNLLHDMNKLLTDIIYEYNNLALTTYTFFVYDKHGEQWANRILTTKNENERKLLYKKLEVLIDDIHQYQKNIINIIKNINEITYSDSLFSFLEDSVKKYPVDSLLYFKAYNDRYGNIPSIITNLFNKNITFVNPPKVCSTLKIYNTSIPIKVNSIDTENQKYLSIIGFGTLPSIKYKFGSKKIMSIYNNFHNDKSNISLFVEQSNIIPKITNKKEITINQLISLDNDKSDNIANSDKERTFIFDLSGIDKRINLYQNLKNNISLYHSIIVPDVKDLTLLNKYDILSQITNGTTKGYNNYTYIPCGESDSSKCKTFSERSKKNYYFKNMENYFNYLFLPEDIDNLTIEDIKKKKGQFEYNFVTKLYVVTKDINQKLLIEKEKFLNKVAEDLINIDPMYKERNVPLINILKAVTKNNTDIINQKINKLYKTFYKDTQIYKSTLSEYFSKYISTYFSEIINPKENKNENTMSSKDSLKSLDFVDKDSEEDDGLFTKILKMVLKLFLNILTLILSLVTWLFTYVGAFFFGLLYSLHTLGIIMILIFFPIEFLIKYIFFDDYKPIIDAFKNYIAYRMIDFAYLFVLTLMGLIAPLLIYIVNTKFDPFVGKILELFLIAFIFKLLSLFISKIFEILNAKDSIGMSNMLSNAGGFISKYSVGTSIQASTYGVATAAAISARSPKVLGTTGKVFNAAKEKIADTKIGNYFEKNVKSMVDNTLSKHPNLINFSKKTVDIGKNAANVVKNATKNGIEFSSEIHEIAKNLRQGNIFNAVDAIGSSAKGKFYKKGVNNQTSVISDMLSIFNENPTKLNSSNINNTNINNTTNIFNNTNINQSSNPNTQHHDNSKPLNTETNNIEKHIIKNNSDLNNNLNNQNNINKN